jgi:hypothetical protein
LLHITGRIRDVIIPMKPHPGGGMPPYPPGGNAPPHHPRQEPAPPHPTGGMPPYPMPSFRADRPMGPFDMVDHRPPPPHSMEHMGADRMPYSYGCEQGGGPRPFLDQPSPSAWAPEVTYYAFILECRKHIYGKCSLELGRSSSAFFLGVQCTMVSFMNFHQHSGPADKR